MSRYCPFCGAVLTKEPSSCPLCGSGIGDGEWISEAQHISMKRSKEEYRRQLEIRHKNHTVSLLLSVVPALFGFLGIGQIYLDRRDPTGWTLLIVGLIWIVFAGISAYAMTSVDMVPMIFLSASLALFAIAYLLTAIIGIKHVIDGTLGFR